MIRPRIWVVSTNDVSITPDSGESRDKPLHSRVNQLSSKYFMIELTSETTLDSEYFWAHLCTNYVRVEVNSVFLDRIVRE